MLNECIHLPISPDRYNPFSRMDRYKPRVTSRESQEPLVASKGASRALKINYGDVEEAIIRLRRQHDLPVASDKVIGDVKMLRSLTETLYHTEGYEGLYSLIVRHFGTLTAANLIPGSVGAFVYGCSTIRTTLDDLAAGPGGAAGLTPGCMPLCVGGIPPPKLPHWASCSHNVILMHVRYRGTEDLRNGGGERSFQILNRSRTSSRTYVFVLLDGKYDESPALSIGDEDFTNAGVPDTKTYQVFLYSGGKCIPMGDTITRAIEESELTGATALEKAPTKNEAAPKRYGYGNGRALGHRGPHNQSDRDERKGGSGGYGGYGEWFAIVGIIIILIILAIVVGFLGRRAMRVQQ